MCGGTSQRDSPAGCWRGLSPRVRGNPRRTVSELTGVRSIPACAGEPRAWRFPSWNAKVYPRVCGGTPGERILAILERGLSPRVRGNRRLAPFKSSRDAGLSPRVRGNRSVGSSRPMYCRSIPACAGEPRPPGSRGRACRVYPRVCGGTGFRSLDIAGVPGLSPRVRGNHLRTDRRPRWHGSIPACAGEPLATSTRVCRYSVYPRVCGGTLTGLSTPYLDQGLSPRVRGNRLTYGGSGKSTGSIPACAGEPIWPERTAGFRGVYPRVCGGTSSAGVVKRNGQGLSPRVRGNRLAGFQQAFP